MRRMLLLASIVASATAAASIEPAAAMYAARNGFKHDAGRHGSGHDER